MVASPGTVPELRHAAPAKPLGNHGRRRRTWPSRKTPGTRVPGRPGRPSSCEAIRGELAIRPSVEFHRRRPGRQDSCRVRHRGDHARRRRPRMAQPGWRHRARATDRRPAEPAPVPLATRDVLTPCPARARPHGWITVQRGTFISRSRPPLFQVSDAVARWRGRAPRAAGGTPPRPGVPMTAVRRARRRAARRRAARSARSGRRSHAGGAAPDAGSGPWAKARTIGGFSWRGRLNRWPQPVPSRTGRRSGDLPRPGAGGSSMSPAMPSRSWSCRRVRPWAAPSAEPPVRRRGRAPRARGGQ